MRRREVIAGLAGAVCAWPLGTLAQSSGRMPLIGVLRAGHKESDPLFDPFRRLLSELGFEDGRNLRLLYRWADGNGERLPALAQELVG